MLSGCLRKRTFVALASLCVAGIVHLSDAQTVAPAPQRRTELIELLRNDCGACHGLYLTGGLGPSLRPEALHDKPPLYLAQTILKGRPGTPMPGWEPFISESEAHWLAESLLRGIPDED